MLIRKLLLALVCALTLCAAWLRPVCVVYMPESREGGSCEAAELAEVLRSARAAADEKPAFDFDTWVRAFAARKYESGFSREMSRSAAVYLKDFEDWDR